MTFAFPLPPNMANGRQHWATKNRARKRYNADCDALQGAGILPPPPREAQSPVVLRIVLYVHQRMDDDNASARVKFPVDWLRTRGYIVDDGHPHCRIPTPAQVVDRKRPRAEIQILPG